MTSERVAAVMLSRANTGKWNGGRVPYGYSWDKKQAEFSLLEKEANIIHQIYNLYESNQSVLYVVRWLNESGFSTRSGHKWFLAWSIEF